MVPYLLTRISIKNARKVHRDSKTPCVLAMTFTQGDKCAHVPTKTMSA